MKTITIARKPLVGTVANNVLEYGCGGLNLDGTRISGDVPEVTGQGFRTGKYGGQIGWGEPTLTGKLSNPSPQGRFPANLILQHLDACRCDGVKKVRSHNPDNKTVVGGASTGECYGDYGKRSIVGHADKDGKETVANWICAEGCPVKNLDDQSGDRPSWGVTHQPKRSGYSYRSEQDGGTNVYREPDKGGASRFFKAVKP